MGRVGSGCEVHGRGAGGGVGGGGEGITGKDESVGRRARLAIVHHGVLLSLLKHTHRERETKRLKSETKLFFGGAKGSRLSGSLLEDITGGRWEVACWNGMHARVHARVCALSFETGVTQL